MSSPSEVTPALLADWGLPAPGGSKKTRGDVLVIGGSLRVPGAVMLAGEAALRVGAGRLSLGVPATIQSQLGVAVPEAAVYPLPGCATDPLEGGLRDAVAAADAVLVGPGFDDADETRATLLAVADAGARVLVLDAFALGVLPSIDRSALPDTLVLNPNTDEAGILVGEDHDGDLTDLVAEIAARYDAVVNCYGTIATPDGEVWRADAGGPILGTSGSGDVLAGAIAGFAARGLPAERAAVWGSWAHARAGDRLAPRLGLGTLARDLPAELPLAIAEVLG